MSAAYDLQPDSFMLCVVRSSEENYKKNTPPPIHEGVVDSPFKGKDEMGCHRTLKAINEKTGSEINYWYFAIMDEQSLRDHSVLLAGYYDETLILTTRAEANLGNIQLGALSVGHQAFPEEQYPDYDP